MSNIKKAIITAAGKGTRQYPASKTVQKELFPLIDTDGYAKPTLQIIAQECVDSGIEEICIIANPTNIDAVKAHFSAPTEEERTSLAGKEWALKLADDLTSLSKRISFVVQYEQKGFGHAVYQAKGWADGESVLVLLGDHLYLPNSGSPLCTKQVLDSYAKWKAPVSSVQPVEESAVVRLGVLKCEALDGTTYKAVDIVEKPTIEQARQTLQTPGVAPGYYLAHFGSHAFPNEIFKKLEYLFDHDIKVKNEFQLTSAQELLLKDSPLYVAQLIQGKRLDSGQPEELIETQILLGLESPYRNHIQKLLQ
jgi:UTP--glucose-1-phosphate uridylyltransferase